MWRPSRVMLIKPAHCEGVVTGSGDASVSPVFSSIRTRHTFMLPPRSLEKYRYRPSGDQTGFQSIYRSFVTATGSPPFAATVQISRCAPCRRPQYAMRYPLGDQLGCLASSIFPGIGRLSPVET